MVNSENTNPDTCDNNVLTVAFNLTREEFIKQEWIKLIGEEEFSKIEIDKNGWLKVSHSDFHFKYNRSIKGEWTGKGYNLFEKGEKTIAYELYVRPRILNEMKKNNGWTKIESVDDLPKEESKSFKVIDKEKGKEYSYHFSFDMADYWMKNFSHYRKKEEYKMPVF